MTSKRRRRSLDPWTNSIPGFVITVIIIVSSVTPERGGIAGGTILTIEGHGFGTSTSAINVDVGDVNCAVTSVSSRVITCTTGPHAQGTVHVTVSSSGTRYTLNDGFTYDGSLQPKITNLNPAKGPVYGGTLLNISGSSFPDDIQDVAVTMGEKPCEVQTTTSTEIICIVPRNPPGYVTVVVDTKERGRASYNGISGNYLSVLRVAGISPKRGSLSGGTMVTIEGEGFSANKSHNEVTFGDERCEVLESAETQLKCVTPKGGKTVNIDNSGSHPGMRNQCAPNASLFSNELIKEF